jgi:hypothetical protein
VSDRLSTVERALELARSGACRTVEDIRRVLKAERCDSVDQHLGGGTLGKQIRAVLAERKLLDKRD